METALSIIGAALIFSPTVLTCVAWWFFFHHAQRVNPLRRAASAGAMGVLTVANAWWYVLPIIHHVTVDSDFRLYEIGGRAGAALALAALPLSLFSTGVLRPVSALAALGTILMWTAIGFYPLH